MPPAQPSALAFSEERLRLSFQERGEKPFRGSQAFTRLHGNRILSWQECTEFPLSLRTELEQAWPLLSLTESHSSQTEEGTEKIILESHPDAIGRSRQFEAVWIVSEHRRTICISSQVGCSLHCSFCATGRLPFQGNLQTDEIVAQVYHFIRKKGELPTNIVFMGMGEPFYNYDAVLQAADLLHDPRGLNLGARHITISTAGVLPGIDRFIEERRPYNLAISLNSPLSERRSLLMDINERYDLKILLEAARRYTTDLKRKITFEYIVMPGHNTDEESHRELIRLVRPLDCRINLIPLNTDFPGFETPTEEEMETFQGRLRAAGILAFNRGNPGKKIAGACGMLALSRK